jgi:YCII-related domain
MQRTGGGVEIDSVNAPTRCRFRASRFVLVETAINVGGPYMPSYMVLYHGPATPADASHAGWPQWFQGLGDRLVDQGSPMTAGFVVHPDGTAADDAASLNGYSVIRAEDRDEVRALLRDHPFLGGGTGYSIEVFEVPAK